MKEQEKSEYEQVISKYYGDEQVRAIIQLKVDTKEADVIAENVAKLQEIEDLFLVTGDADLVAKVRFENYPALKRFIVDRLSKVQGIRETRTMMVVTTFKENHELKFEEQKS